MLDHKRTCQVTVKQDVISDAGPCNLDPYYYCQDRRQPVGVCEGIVASLWAIAADLSDSPIDGELL